MTIKLLIQGDFSDLLVGDTVLTQDSDDEGDCRPIAQVVMAAGPTMGAIVLHPRSARFSLVTNRAALTLGPRAGAPGFKAALSEAADA